MESKWRRRGRWRWLRGSIPVPAGCRNRTFWPPKRSLVAAELWDVFGKIVDCFRVFSIETINRRKCGIGMLSSQRGDPSAPPPSRSRRGLAWRPRASPGLVLLAHGVFWWNRDVRWFSSNSENISRLVFLKWKNSRKQELTLWHLVNRLVPENA